MKVIIAGSRGITSIYTVEDAVKLSCFEVTEVVCGMARGVDFLGMTWAESNDIPVKKMPADWDNHGRGAGFIRNRLMAEYADALIAIWDGESRGTEHMIRTAKAVGIKLFVYMVPA